MMCAEIAKLHDPRKNDGPNNAPTGCIVVSGGQCVGYCLAGQSIWATANENTRTQRRWNRRLLRLASQPIRRGVALLVRPKRVMAACFRRKQQKATAVRYLTP